MEEPAHSPENTLSAPAATTVSNMLTAFTDSLEAAENDAPSRTGVQTTTRIRSRFDSVTASRKKVSLVGDRTYERYRELLSGIQAEAPDTIRLKASDINGVNRENCPNRLAWYSWLVITALLTLLAWTFGATRRIRWPSSGPLPGLPFFSGCR